MDTTPGPAPLHLPILARARIAVSIVFFLLGFGSGLWAVHIPIIKARLGIDAGTLGLAMFTMAIGAVIGMPVMAGYVARHGSRRPTMVGSFVGTLIAPLPILAPSVFFLFASTFIFGLALGGLDVAMNTQASEVEKLRGRPSMSLFHGFFSLGGLVGALVSAGVIAIGWGNGGGAAVACIILLGAAAYAGRGLLPNARPADMGPRFAWPTRAVVGLGVIALLSFALEGAVGDWSALFLATVKGASPSTAASGFAMFSLTMVIFRLVGDTVVEKLGPRTTLTLGGGLIALGFAIAVLSPWTPLSALGFALVGIGAANVVPVVFSAGARVPGVPPSIGIAAVVTFGYFGFLVAPPLLGFVAQAANLSLSLWIAALGGLVVAILGGFRRG